MYHLLTIDLVDTYIYADVFDEDKYKTIGSSESIVNLISPAVTEFLDRNAWLGKNFLSEKWEKEAENQGTDTIIIDDKGKTFFRGSMLTLGDEVAHGLALAKKYHGQKKRKVDGGEEIIHLLDVGYLIYRNIGHAPILISAGFCHDLLEDTNCPEEEIQKLCGDEVLRIVKAVTNDPNLSGKDQWENKKLKYINSVENGGIGAIMVSLADKIANLRSLKDSYSILGRKVWNNFNRGKKEKIWFEEQVYNMCSKHTTNSLIKQYADLIGDMKKMDE